MSWIDLGNPRPRPEARRHSPVRWADGERIALKALAELPSVHGIFQKSLIDLSMQRRSNRAFELLPLDHLGWLLALVDQQLAKGPRDLGFALTQRPAPSAGAIHPIHLIVQSPGLVGWHRYDSEAHELVRVQCQASVDEVRAATDELLAAPKASLVLLVAEFGRTAAKYENSASLVWRDAGVLLGYLSLAAEALDLAFLSLGITGDSWAQRLVDETGLAGVGAAFVGTRT